MDLPSKICTKAVICGNTNKFLQGKVPETSGSIIPHIQSHVCSMHPIYCLKSNDQLYPQFCAQKYIHLGI